MEELIALLHAYGRFLELEDHIPYWEDQCAELRIRIRELQLNRNCRQTDLDNLENPNFFQRLFGRAEEKKEKIGKQLREITAAYNAATWELKDLERKISEGKQEREALSGSREAYEKGKRAAALSVIQENQLVMEEIAAFTPVAIATVDRIVDALEEARPWMQQDAVRKGVGPENRKLQCLSRAEQSAQRLCSILAMMPEGVAPVGSYLRSPSHYIVGVTSEYGQLDRLNLAISQVQETGNQLRMLQ